MKVGIKKRLVDYTNINKLARIVKVFYAWMFLLGFSWIFINCVFMNSNDLVHYNINKIFIFGVLILALLLGIYFIIDRYKHKFTKINSSRFMKTVILGVIFITMIGLQVFLAKSFYYDHGWDAGMLIRNGKSLASDLSSFDSGYYQRFPNNIFLVWMFKYVYYISNFLGFVSYEFLLIIINIVSVDISILVLAIIARKIFNKSVAVMAYIIATLIYLFSPWIIVPYSDSLSMVFPVIIFYIYLKIKDTEDLRIKIILSFAIGVLGTIGFQIKPTAIIIIVAITVSNLIYNLKDKKSILTYVVTTVAIAFGFLLSKGVYDRYIANINVNGVILNDNKDSKTPATHFLMMGLQTKEIEGRGFLYGAWSQDEYDITFSEKAYNEKVRRNLHEVKERLKALGVKGYLEYASKKINWMLSDGTFYYGGEGATALSKPHDTSETGQKIQSYYMPDGKNYQKLADYEEGVWAVILLLIVIPIFIRNKEIENENLFIIRLTVTGIVIFLLLFEGRSRYLINHLPFFFLLAAYGLGSMFNRIKVRINKNNMNNA